MERSRPLAVTIVTILMIISGISLLFNVIGPVTIVLAIARFVLAWGLFTGKGWAWIITVILAIISVIFSLIGIASGGAPSIVSLIINGVILYYMYRPNVRAYFGRVKIPK